MPSSKTAIGDSLHGVLGCPGDWRPDCAADTPEVGLIVGGAGSVTQGDDGVIYIDQHSHYLAIDWHTSNVAASKSVRISQPSASAAVLIRIMDQNPGQIFDAIDSIDANGRIFLINPNGIVFGETVRLKSGSLVASTLDLTTEKFMSGIFDLRAPQHRADGMIMNRGVLESATDGSITLAGSQIINEGLIHATVGQVYLGTGSAATVDFDGAGLLMSGIGTAGVEASGLNAGGIANDANEILQTAHPARDVTETINNQGLIKAGRVEHDGGVIRLVSNGGSVVNSGGLVARGLTSADTGGRISVLGHSVRLQGGAMIDASGTAGGGAVYVGGGVRGQDTSVANADRVYLGQQASIDASARGYGDGGTVVVWGADSAQVYGTIAARGGEHGGNGGFVETSGRRALEISLAPDIGAGGQWLIDPHDLTIAAGAGNSNISPVDPFVTAGDSASLGVDLIRAALTGGAGVLIETSDAGTQQGNITWSGTAVLDYDGTATNSLTLDADNDIIFEAGATITDFVAGSDSLDLTLIAANDARFEGASIELGAGVLTVNFGQAGTGGNLTVEAGTTFATGGAAAMGGAGNDTVSLNSSAAGFDFGISTFGGNDTFVFADTVSIGGSIDGGAGADTLDWSFYTTARDVMLTSGVNGDEASIAGGFVNIDELIGSSATGDTLTGFFDGGEWTLSAGTYDAGGDMLTFSAFESLTGGGAVDIFQIDTVFAGDIDGGGGDDDFFIAGGGSAGSIEGGADGSDDLYGNDTANSWIVDAAGGGTLNGQDFSGIENLIGGTLMDTFDFRTGGSMGSVDGAEAADVLTFAMFGSAVAVELTAVDSALGFDGTASDIPPGPAVVTGFIGIDEVIGSAAADSLTGFFDGGEWTLSAGTYEAGGDLLTFSAFESLTGGGAVDIFQIDNVFAGDIDGGGGDDDFFIAGGGSAGSIEGGADGSDDLYGNDTANSWIVDAAGGGTLNGQDFSGIENLIGGTLMDTFDFRTGGSMGSVDGADGADVLTFAMFGSSVAVELTAVVTVFGFEGTATALSDDFRGIDELSGSAEADSLTGHDVAATWTLDMADVNMYSSEADFTLAFSGFEMLVGGTGGDTFNVDADPTVVNDVDGGAGLTADATDELTFADLGGPVMLMLDAARDEGYGGTDDVIGVFARIDSVVGSAGADSLTGHDVAATWTLDMADVNTYSSEADFTLAFSGFEALVGGSGNDIFDVDAVPTVVNDVDGGAGLTADATDELTFADLGGPVMLMLDAASDEGYGGTDDVIGVFARIDSVVGSAGADSLTGHDVAATWTLDMADVNTYSSEADFTLAFSGFEALVGSSGNDIFDIDAVPTVVGSVDGGAGVDTLDWSAHSTTRDVILTAAGPIDGVDGIEASIGGGFTNIDALIGSGLIGDRLTGANVAITWTLFSTDGGTIALGSGDDVTFSSFEDLIGGGGDDSFTLAGGTASATIDGGAGMDQLTADNVANNWLITGADSGTVNGVSGFINIEDLVGGTTNDSFMLAGGTVSGTIDGADGMDQLTADNVANSWVITGSYAGTVTGVGGFINVEDLTGGTSTDSFSLDGTAGIVRGLAGNDTFIMLPNATIAAIDGGSGSDALDYSMFGAPDGLVIIGLEPDGYNGSGNGIIGMFSGIDTFVASPFNMEECSMPGVPIPDDVSAGVSDSIIFQDDSRLRDVDLSVTATHTWVGDLVFTLTHEDTGTSVVVIDRPGLPLIDPDFGCSGDNIDVVLDDDAAGSFPHSFADDQCSAAPPAIGGTHAPSIPLSAFIGESLAGTWTLNVSDHFGRELGTLDEWCLIPTTHDIQYFRGHAYELVTDTLTWEDADAFAQAQVLFGVRGHLAVITSAAENAFIIDAFDVDTDSNFFGPFIGLFCTEGASCALPSSYEWVTGEAFSYSGFSPGVEPNGDCPVGPSSPRCGVGFIDINVGWNDYAAEAQNQFVIEYPLPDTDNDSIHDSADNCTDVANADQRDTDGDLIGNACDADINGDCIVNFQDGSAYKANFFMPGDLDTDNNGDSLTNLLDLALLKTQFLGSPGPSAAGCDAQRYAIGQRGPRGGIVIYVTDGGLHGLEAALPPDQSAGTQWGCLFTNTGATGEAIGDGKTNTRLIVGNACSASGDAARVAADHDGGGLSDWFLPSRDELNQLYLQRAFVRGLVSDLYWSSSEFDEVVVWAQTFDDGSQSNVNKGSAIRVRAVRAF